MKFNKNFKILAILRLFKINKIKSSKMKYNHQKNYYRILEIKKI